MGGSTCLLCEDIDIEFSAIFLAIILASVLRNLNFDYRYLR